MKLFGVDTISIDFDKISEMLHKDYERKVELEKNGKSKSIVDLSLYQIYAPDLESAEREWNKSRSMKSSKTKKFISDNPGTCDSSSVNNP